MIRGQVNEDFEAVAPLELITPGGAVSAVHAVIDTGFNGALTLPAKLIEQFGLKSAGERRATLADGSIVVLSMAFVKIRWFGETRDILVLQAEGGPLAGMSLFKDCRLTIESRNGGPVTIERLNAFA